MKSSYLTDEEYLLEVVRCSCCSDLKAAGLSQKKLKLYLNSHGLYRRTYQLLLLWGGDINMPHADKDYSMTVMLLTWVCPKGHELLPLIKSKTFYFSLPFVSVNTKTNSS